MFPKSSNYTNTLRKPFGKNSHFRTHSGEHYPLGKTKKRANSKHHKRCISTISNILVSLEGKTVVKAPKIFSNQIFSDVYDAEGNHDRIMELSAEQDQDFDSNQQFVSAELLKLPSAGRNSCNGKKILFYS